MAGIKIRNFCNQEVISELKEREWELLALGNAIEKSIYGVAFFEPDGTLKYLNPAILKMWGYDEEERESLIGTCAFDYLAPATQQKVHNLITASLETGLTDEILAIKKDGSSFWARVTIFPNRDEKGRLLVLVAFVEDITENKKMEENLRRSEELYRLIFENMLDGYYRTDSCGKLILANESLVRILGYDSDKEMLGKDIATTFYCNPQERDEFLKDLEQSGGRVVDRNVCLKKKDGSLIIASANSRYYYDSAENLAGVEGVLRDITHRLKMEEELRKAKTDAEVEYAKLHAMISGMEEGVVFADADDKIVEANEYFCRIFEKNCNDIIGRSMWEFYYGKAGERLRKIVTSCKQGLSKEPVSINRRIGKIYATFRVQPILRHGQYEGVLLNIIDVTELVQARIKAEKAREQAERLAATDYLTGLLNRRAFIERLETEVNRAVREDASIGIILTDIDRFKKINDTYGHQVGDVVLQEFAACLSQLCRPYDFIGRYGGEEFIICLPGTTCEQAANIAERMRVAVQEQQILLPDSSLHIGFTASFGVTSMDGGPGESVDSLIGRVDAAMYRAKDEGRNRVCVASK